MFAVRLRCGSSGGALGVRTLATRRNKRRGRPLFVRQPFNLDVPFDHPDFGQVPASSPLFGPKPARGTRKRPAVYWRLARNSALWLEHYADNDEMANLEQQRCVWPAPPPCANR